MLRSILFHVMPIGSGSKPSSFSSARESTLFTSAKVFAVRSSPMVSNSFC